MNFVFQHLDTSISLKKKKNVAKRYKRVPRDIRERTFSDFVHRECMIRKMKDNKTNLEI